MEMKSRVLSIFKRCHCPPYASLRYLSTAIQAERSAKQERKKKKKTHDIYAEVLSSHEEKRIRKKLLKETKSKHTFRQLYPWKTKLEFAQHLKHSQVYYKDGLLAVNKPYGIPVLGHKMDLELKQNVIQTLSLGGTPEGIPSLQETLPLLQDLYGVPHMEIIKAPERWTSGVTLLGTQPDIKQMVQKSLRRSLAAQLPPVTYWAVVHGKTKPETFTGKVGMTLEAVEEKGKVPVITLDYTKTAVKEATVKVNCVHHEVLVSNEETSCSLLEVKVQNKRWHFLRVWCAHNFSPILGDMLYGGRVRRVAGKPILISPHNMTAYNPPKIFPSTLSRLGLSENTQELIPCHLHLYNICLEQHGRRKSSLNISVPPPQHFVWSCFQLGLMADPAEMGIKEAAEEETLVSRSTAESANYSVTNPVESGHKNTPGRNLEGIGMKRSRNKEARTDLSSSGVECVTDSAPEVYIDVAKYSEDLRKRKHSEDDCKEFPSVGDGRKYFKSEDDIDEKIDISEEWMFVESNQEQDIMKGRSRGAHLDDVKQEPDFDGILLMKEEHD